MSDTDIAPEPTELERVQAAAEEWREWYEASPLSKPTSDSALDAIARGTSFVSWLASRGLDFEKALEAEVGRLRAKLGLKEEA